MTEPDEDEQEQEFQLMIEKLNSTLSRALIGKRTEKKEEEIVIVVCLVISSHV